MPVPPASRGWGGSLGEEQRISVQCNDSSNPRDPWAWSDYARRADGVGHGARGHSACIDGALNAYSSDGALPAEGTVCEPDRGPFDPMP